MKSIFLKFIRWILFLWVKVEVFPDNDPKKVLNPERPILYVLADRGVSDLLVLTEVCSQHGLTDPLQLIPINSISSYRSVYSIASSQPFTDWLRRRDKNSQLLSDFVEAGLNDTDFDLQIVPVSVFWGRPLARQKHWLQVLFSDTWSLANRSRKLLTILVHGRNTRLIFSEALSFREISANLNHDATSIHDFLINQLSEQQEATFGPKIKSRRQLTAEVLDDELIQQFIAGQKESKKRLLSQARKYSREIFADSTQLTIELMLRLLRFFWNRFYSGIEIYNIDKVKQAALGSQLVYVPCHRSHVDYLLLSYVIFNENLAIPYIAAGNNLNLPFIGRILRGGGAFFIRRSFKDKPLYGLVMRAYIRKLVQLGVPLEYFIEGGRSRSGRMLKPKFGMLGMTVEAYINQPVKPLAFIPVYIGYEKLLEGKSYIGELYGEKKKSESTLTTLRAIFKLSGRFGKVTASFGDPIDLSELLSQNNPDWTNAADELEHKPEWYQNSLAQLSQSIMHNIHRAAVVNPVNAIATVLLATSRQSIEIEVLAEQCGLHARLIGSTNGAGKVRISEEVGIEQIERVAEQKLIHIKRHPLGDIVYLKPKDSVQMGYYRNNILHSLIIPALIACCFTNRRELSLKNIVEKVSFLYPFLQSDLQLEWDQNDLSETINEYVASMIKEALLTGSKNSLERPRRSDNQFMQLIRLAQIAQPILERYYMTFIVLRQSSETPQTEAEIEHRCHLLAQKISMIYGINSPDFFDRMLFRDFIATMLNSGYLIKNEQEQLLFAVNTDYLRPDLRSLLSTEVRSSILSLIKN